MTYHWTRRDRLADLRQTLVEQALYIMVRGENSGQPKLPAPFASTSRTMFSCLPDRQSRILLEPIAEYHKLNIVAASTMPSTGNISFDLGVHLSWRISWQQGFLLWEGPDERAFFIPEDLDGNVRFWIEDGDLYCDKGLPFANRADRENGLDAATRRLARLIGEA